LNIGYLSAGKCPVTNAQAPNPKEFIFNMASIPREVSMFRRVTVRFATTFALISALVPLASAGQSVDGSYKIIGARSTLRFLALGDSYTIGDGVAPSQRWPELVAVALRRAHSKMSDPEIIAKSGWDTKQLAEGLNRRLPTGPYRLVTLMIGVNNQYRGESLETFRTELTALLRAAVRLTGGHAGRVVVISIPDWGASPAGRSDRAKIGEDIDRFNDVVRIVARNAGSKFVDVTAASRAAEGDKSMFVYDGLHPSPLQHAAWAELIVPVAEAAITRK
jgi:lysophospholipase L1-like esterase